MLCIKIIFNVEHIFNCNIFCLMLFYFNNCGFISNLKFDIHFIMFFFSINYVVTVPLLILDSWPAQTFLFHLLHFYIQAFELLLLIDQPYSSVISQTFVGFPRYIFPLENLINKNFQKTILFWIKKNVKG